MNKNNETTTSVQSVVISTVIKTELKKHIPNLSETLSQYELGSDLEHRMESIAIEKGFLKETRKARKLGYMIFYADLIAIMSWYFLLAAQEHNCYKEAEINIFKRNIRPKKCLELMYNFSKKHGFFEQMNLIRSNAEKDLLARYVEKKDNSL